MDNVATCRNCGQEIAEKICVSCEQAAQLKRIDSHYVWHELLHLLHFEKGFLYNVRELMTRPGSSIREYIEVDRTRHMKPVGFLVLTSLIYTIVSHYLEVDTVNDRHFESSPHTNAVLHWVSAHYGYANIMMSAVTALFVYLFFRKYRYNLFEIMVLMCFIVGQGMLLLALICCLHGVLSKLAYGLLFSFSVFAYATWVIGRFFDGGKVVNYFKAVVAYFLGYLVFYVLLVAVGLAADLVTGQLGAH